MSFKDLSIEKVYRNLSSNVIDNFYIPVLKEATSYKRAVGYFTSAAFYEIATGLKYLVINDGHIQLIVSPKLEEEDVEAIIKGYKTRDEIIANAILREFKDPITEFQQKKLNLLANLIAEGKLDIKVAFKQDRNSVGIFHEKIGILEDASGNKIAFGGSMNETYSGLLQNYESIDVFCSFREEDAERVKLKERDFDELWNNTHHAMEIIDFPKVAIERLNQYRVDYGTNELVNKIPEIIEKTDDFTPKTDNSEIFFRTPTKEQGFDGFYDYQERAIKTWLDEENGRGIFDMATGSGKTLTGLGALAALSIKLKDNLAVFIVCPQTHLVEQWVEDIRWFGVEPLICYGSRTDYLSDLKKVIRQYNAGPRVRKNFCVITTNASYVLPPIQEAINKIKGDICILVDEAHNFGAELQRQHMIEKIQYRIALSATLERHRDEEGTTALTGYFGKYVIRYTLEQAIKDGKLCEYYYYPIPVTLEADELEAYNVLSEKISNLMRKFPNEKNRPEVVNRLLIKRARIISGARDKLKKLYEIMQHKKKEKNILVYCGAVKIPKEDYIGTYDYEYEDEDNERFDGTIERQINIVADMLGNKLDMRISKFTAEEDKKEREIIKKRFAEGELQCVVAVKCLDEGMNIPGINTAFILASSTNPKEYIQRRGRVLRKAKGKDCAYIYDFVTFPHDLDLGYVDPRTEKYELGLIKRERERMDDFQRLCRNPSDTEKLIDKIDELYDLNTIKLED